MPTIDAIFVLLGLIALVLLIFLVKARALTPLTWAGIVIGSGITGSILCLSA